MAGELELARANRICSQMRLLGRGSRLASERRHSLQGGYATTPTSPHFDLNGDEPDQSQGDFVLFAGPFVISQSSPHVVSHVELLLMAVEYGTLIEPRETPAAFSSVFL